MVVKGESGAGLRGVDSLVKVLGEVRRRGVTVLRDVLGLLLGF